MPIDNINTTSVWKLINRTRIRTTLNLVLSILACLFFLAFAIRPTLTTITTLKNQLQHETQILTLLEQKLQVLQMAEAAYYQNQKYLDRLNRALPQTPEITKFNQQVVYLANKSSVKIVSLSFGQFDLLNEVPIDTKTPAKNESITFMMSVRAPWPQIKTFMRDLENLDRFTLVYNIDQTASGRENDDINASFQGAIYFFPKKGYL